MNRSIEGVVTFLQDNDSLIKQLMETAESATNFSARGADINVCNTAIRTRRR